MKVGYLPEKKWPTTLSPCTIMFTARCTLTLHYTVQCKVSSTVCTKVMRKLFFRDDAILANNLCGFVKFSVTNSLQYCAQCSVQNNVWHIVLFSVENKVMHNVQQTKGGIPQAKNQLTQLISAQPSTLMYGYMVFYRTVESTV